MDTWEHSTAQFDLESSPPDEYPAPEAVDTRVETDQPWRAIEPPPVGDARTICFVDGVRRFARRLIYWGPDGGPQRGVCASVAAGSCRWHAGEQPKRAEFGRLEAVHLCLFGGGIKVDLPVVGGVEFENVRTEATDFAQLAKELLDEMRKLEANVTREEAAAGNLVIADGTLGRSAPRRQVIGYIKSQHRAYLDDPDQLRLAGFLGCGQRTPLFSWGENFKRYGWYLGLGGRADPPPWTTIARCEVLVGAGRQEAAGLADLTARLLPMAVLPPWRESRAPQNLAPIAALEHRLRRELGDPGLMRRAIDAAAAQWRPE